ncbi:hypothetical protein DRO69_02175 [Candidatus Bathyarchaeota archaeon]|nr:MAG: hypothetical protein DRO69_02175 [Candidatus Bathyarchaeota archaeon]
MTYPNVVPPMAHTAPTADVVVYREGNLAVAVGAKTKIKIASSTDHAQVIQKAIDHVANKGGGRLYIKSGVYCISDTITISKPIHIEGEFAGFETFPADEHDMSYVKDVSGVILEVIEEGKDAIRIENVGLPITLKNLVIKFSSNLSKTGHGIACIPPILASDPALRETGICYFLFENVNVIGHDGDHYGFYIVNPCVGTLIQIFSYGGGGLFIESNGKWHCGNLVVIHPYVIREKGGTAHCYHLKTTNPDKGSLLNLMQFLRPQCINRVNDGGYRWRDEGAKWYGVYEPDLEGYGNVDISDETVWVSSFGAPHVRFLGRTVITTRLSVIYSGEETVPANTSSINVNFADKGLADYGSDRYKVLALPEWDTTVYVTNKSTSGFTLNFGSPPTTDSKVYWLVIEP